MLNLSASDINHHILDILIDLSKWISENGYVTNKDELWYKPSVYPRVYLDNEQLIEEFYECTHL